MLYLLHATLSVGGTGSNSAQHYLGWTTPERLTARLATHRKGHGSKLTQAFMRVPGQQLLLARVWPEGDRWAEKRLHQNGHLSRFCPLCNPRAPILLVPEPLRHRASLHSRLHLPRREPANGGVSPVGNPTGDATWSRVARRPESGTGWASDQAQTGAIPGGTATSAPAMPSGPASTSSAGTRPRVR